MQFNRAEWAEKITEPTWYLEIPALLKEFSALHDSDKVAYEALKEEVYAFFESQLAAGRVCVDESPARNGFFDRERKPIDTIVIHHTHGEPGMTKERLSAMQIVRLYAPEFAKPNADPVVHTKGERLYSGHVRNKAGTSNGQQVFYPYHWFVRADGTLERLLLDTETGWHAGNWEINCRSVAITFDNDYEHGTPSVVELAAVAKLIREQYPQVPKERIFGHREINLRTTCPSELYLSEKNSEGAIIRRGWKEDLLKLIQSEEIGV